RRTSDSRTPCRSGPWGLAPWPREPPVRVSRGEELLRFSLAGESSHIRGSGARRRQSGAASRCVAWGDLQKARRSSAEKPAGMALTPCKRGKDSTPLGSGQNKRNVGGLRKTF